MCVVAVGGRWARGELKSWREHCGVSRLQLLPWEVVWCCVCTQNRQHNPLWSVDSKVSWGCLPMTNITTLRKSKRQTQLYYIHAWVSIITLCYCRGYSGKKLSDNIQCEIFQTILEEARDSYPDSIVYELSSNLPEELERNVEAVCRCVREWTPSVEH